MDELVLPVARGDNIFRLLACGGFTVVGASMVIGGLSYPEGWLMTALGGLCCVMFGFVFAQSLRTARSRGLRLTAHGFELDRHTHAWTDVVGFHAASGTHLLVQYADHARSRSVRVSEALGRLGFYTAPAYIAAGAFDTGGRPLEDILRQWRLGERTSAAAPDPAADLFDPAHAPLDELIIPLSRRWEDRFIAVVAALWFLLAAVSIPLAVSDTDNSPWWMLLTMGGIWVACTAFLGYVAFESVRELRSPGLRLTDKGFQFGGQSWLWSSITEFETILVHNDDGTTSPRFRAIGTPGHEPLPELTFQPGDVDTGGQPVVEILREWLRRYGISEQS